MPLSKLKILQASVRSFKSTIEQTPRTAKDTQVSAHLARHYNDLLEKAAQYEELKDHLPSMIHSTSPFSEMGFSDATYTDLLVYLNQLIMLTDLLEE